jgi:uncharacterized protein YabE (DUF348 family)
MRPLQRFSVAGLVVLFLAGAGVVFYLNAGKGIQIQVDGRALSVATNAGTVGAALAQAGVSLDPGDQVAPPLNGPVDPATPIIVTRAALLSVSADGRTSLVHAPGNDWAGLFTRLGLNLARGDVVAGDGLPISASAAPIGAWPRSLQVWRAVEVSIVDGSRPPRAVSSAVPTVGAALWQAGYQLFAGDAVQPPLDSPLSAGLSIRIARAQMIAVRADGRTIQGRTRAGTVGQALADLGLPLVGGDYSVPPDDQPLPADGQIRVVRVREEVLSDQQLIPYDTIYQALPNVDIDNLQLVQAGAPGVQRKLTRVRYEDGQEVSRVPEAQAQLQKPVAQIIGYGTNITIRALDTPDGPIEYWRAYTMYATSYAAKFTDRTPGSPTYGLTASGKILTKGLVAIDRRLMPFGTRMYVPGYGFAEAADIGSGVKGRFIDLGFDDFNYENWHMPVMVYFLTPAPPADQIHWIIPSTVP